MTTKFSFLFSLFLLGIYACNPIPGNNTGAVNNDESFVSQQVNGKFTVDHATAEELKIMENTVGNFTQMIKRQPENMAAYNEYGNLLQLHIDRVNKFCRLDENSKTVLCRNLDLIKEKIPQLQQNEAAMASRASKDIQLLFAKIDSSFAFRN